MKKFLSILLASFMIIYAFVFTGCENESEDVEITLIFDYSEYDGVKWDEDFDEEIIVKSGEKIGKFPKPTLEGYKFDGWYEDPEDSNTKLRTTTKYSGDETEIVLFAKFNPDTLNKDEAVKLAHNSIYKLDSNEFDSIRVTYTTDEYIEKYAFDTNSRVGYQCYTQRGGDYKYEAWFGIRGDDEDAYAVVEEDGERTAIEISIGDFYELLDDCKKGVLLHTKDAIDTLSSALDDFELSQKGGTIELSAILYEDKMKCTFVFTNGLLTKVTIDSLYTITIEYDVELSMPRI